MPDPLHPAAVHIPIALALLMPFCTVLTLVAVHRQFLPSRAWGIVVLLQGILVLSSIFALRTGEDQEERVARVVPAEIMDVHQEYSEWFLRVAALTLLFAGAGLLDKRTGRVGRGVTVPLTIVVLILAIRVGHTGGELVYKHGAAAAYTESTPVRAPDDPNGIKDGK